MEEKQQVVDRLVVEIFELQKLLYRKDHKHDDAADDVHDVGVKIENLWAEYLEEANKFGKPIEIPCSGGIQYRNAYTAMTVAYFSAARILLSTILSPQVAQFPGSGVALDHHDLVILNCSSYIMQKDIGCAYLRMFLPLTLVARHSASNEKRTLARTLLELRNYGAPFNGLRAIVLRQVQSA